MGFDAKKYKETSGMVPPDTILDGVIIKIIDGAVQDFVTNTENWKGDLTGPCINVTVMSKYKPESGEEMELSVDKLFTYKLGNDGVTEFSGNSNLAKYKAKYGKLPEVGDSVKLISNSEGFLRVKID